MSGLRSAISGVLDSYLASRMSERFGKASRGWSAIMRMRDSVEGLAIVRSRPELVVKASAGQGGWANVPWVALLDRRETETTQQGVYVIYLFRADMSGVYLTLNQGVTRPLAARGPLGGRLWLQENAATLRTRVPTLMNAGFASNTIDLRTPVASGAHYSASTIAHVLIEAGAVADEDALVQQLSAALRAYEGLVSTPAALSAVRSSR